MLGLFVALGIAILTLVVILLWFVPHLLQQQARQMESEAAQLRDMLFDMLSEQEDVTRRQGQLGTSVFYLQEQFDQIAQASSGNEQHNVLPSQGFRTDDVYKLEVRVRVMQKQIERYMQADRTRSQQDNESWAYVLALLSSIMEHIGQYTAQSAYNQSQERRRNTHEHRCH